MLEPVEREEEVDVPDAIVVEDIVVVAAGLLPGDTDVVLELGAGRADEEREEDTVPAAALEVELTEVTLEEARPEVVGLVL